MNNNLNQHNDLKLLVSDLAQYFVSECSDLACNMNDFYIAHQYDARFCNYATNCTTYQLPQIDLLGLTYDYVNSNVDIHIAAKLSRDEKKLLINAIHQWGKNTQIPLPSLKLGKIRMHKQQNLTKNWSKMVGWHNTVIFNNEPMYLLYKDANDEVFGFSVTTMNQLSATLKIASSFVEPKDVHKLLSTHSYTRKDSFIHDPLAYDCINPKIIYPQPLNELKKGFDNTLRMKQYTVMYDETKAEWLAGNWVSASPYHYGIGVELIPLLSVVDFCNTPCSGEKRQTIREHGVGGFNYQLRTTTSFLLECISTAHNAYKGEPDDMFSDDDAVKKLCAWWNTNAPIEMRCATTCRIFKFDGFHTELISYDEDEDEFITQKDIMALKSLALFDDEKQHGSTYLVVFLKGKSAENQTIYDAAGNIFEISTLNDQQDFFDPLLVNKALLRLHKTEYSNKRFVTMRIGILSYHSGESTDDVFKDSALEADHLISSTPNIDSKYAQGACDE